MNIITDIGAMKPLKPSAVALGFFDGVHTAHRRVLDKADGNGLLRTAFTFSTEKNAENARRAKLITTDEVKTELLSDCGMDVVVMPPFHDISQINYRDFFVDLLIGKLSAKKISCGYDYSFGAEREGTVEKLRALCSEYGVELSVLPRMSDSGITVSSSEIRARLEQGDVKRANTLLGYPYYIKSEVIHGRRLGSTLGFPTINQGFSDNQIIPRRGVYATKVYTPDGEYRGITNIGIKPTVGGTEPIAETYISEFSGDLYGKSVKVSLYEFIRDERKFNSLDELKAQIEADKIRSGMTER